MSSIFDKFKNFWLNQNPRTRKINRNIVYSLIIRGIGILISLILVPITLDYLNNYEYGIWITLNSILTWINFFDIGLGNGLRNKLAEAVAHKDLKLGQKYVSSTFFLTALISFSICVLMLVANQYINWNYLLNVDASVNNLKLIVGATLISICIGFVTRNVGIIYLSFQQTWINGLLACLGSLLSLLWIIVMKLTMNPSLLWVAIAYSFSPVIIYLIAYPITFYKKYPELRPTLRSIKAKYFKSLGGLGIKFFILQMACLIIFSTSNFIVSHIFTPAEVTPYNICFKYFNLIVMTFGIISAPFWTAITDAYTKQDVTWIKINVKKMMRICLLLCLILVIMIFVSKPIFIWWVGNDVIIPYSLSISLAVYTAIYLWTSMCCCYSNGTGKLEGQIYSMSIAAVCFIPLSFALANLWGVIGIAYAMGVVLLVPSIWLTKEYIKSIKELEYQACSKG